MSGLEAMIKQLLSNGTTIKTNWYVISGPPCAGKSTVIKSLQAKGYHTNADLSRCYFEEQLKAGREMNVLRSSGNVLHREIFEKMLHNAHTLSSNQLIFHDYALPDNIAFREADGLPEDPELMQACNLYRYRAIFILDPLPFENDQSRLEDEQYQQLIYKKLKTVYPRLGYEPINIPVMSVEERCSLILSHINA